MCSMQDDLDLAVQAAREAGGVVMKYFRTDMDVVHKSADQPVTHADLAADALLKERLLASRSEYGWLSEETADSPERLGRELVWIVDPIDGTRSFIAGRPEFSISIGLAYAGRPAIGVVYNPATGEMFSTIRGSGVLKNGNKLVRPTIERRRVLVCSRTERRRGDFVAFEEGFDFLPLGSTAYKLAKVAEGSADVFLSRGPKSEWDLCAGDLLVRELGGVVTDLTGEALQYNRPVPQITGVLAAPQPLHTDMLDRLNRL